MVRKSEVFVEYESGAEMPLSWARALATDLKRSGRYRAVKVSSRRRDAAVAMGRVWVDQRSRRAMSHAAGTVESPVEPVAAGSGAGKEAENGEVA